MAVAMLRLTARTADPKATVNRKWPLPFRKSECNDHNLAFPDKASPASSSKRTWKLRLNPTSETQLHPGKEHASECEMSQDTPAT